MPARPVVRLGDPVLRTPAERLAPERLAEPVVQELIDDLLDTMLAEEGVGLAAPQLGVGWQVFVYGVAEGRDDPEPEIPLRVVVNPMLEPEPGELVFDWEGCLSIPDLRGLVPRHPAVRLRGLDRQGQSLDLRLEGFEARIAQHELDHLNGVVFLDRMRDFQSLGFADEIDEFVLADEDEDDLEAADSAQESDETGDAETASGAHPSGGG